MPAKRLSLAVVLAMFLVATYLPASARAADWEFPKEWFWHDTDEQRAKHTPLLGKPMPELKVSDPLVKELKREDLKGKIVVLDFWATWCGPCIAAIPKNNELAKKYADQGVIVMGICSGRGQEKYQQIVETRGVQYPNVRDPDNKTAEAFNVMWFPTYVVIDRKGNVRAIGVATDKVEDVVKRLLEEKPA
jgi:thiol-disulfide isomerase/thioredoxin